MKERKKYGLKAARRAPQFSKKIVLSIYLIFIKSLEVINFKTFLLYKNYSIGIF